MKGRTGKTSAKLIPEPHGQLHIDTAGEKMIGRKHGGKVDGKKPKDRADKRARGGWIKGAIKHPGAEKKAAAKAGMSTHAYMEEHKHDSGKAGSRARLGLTLSKMNKK